MLGRVLQSLPLLRGSREVPRKTEEPVEALSGDHLPEPDNGSAGEGPGPGAIGVVIVTGSCCVPGMAPFEERARQMVEQAIAETGVGAEVRMMPATTAYMGGVPKKVMAELIGGFNETGRITLPAVLVNGEVVNAGAVDLEDVKAALRRAASTQHAEGEES